VWPQPPLPQYPTVPAQPPFLLLVSGSFALAVLAVAGDKSAAIKSSLVFYRPTGPLSGVTTAAILMWLLTWGILEWRWRNRTVAVGRISVVALALLALSLLLTFPPVVDLF
jgi:hypothetical protein